MTLEVHIHTTLPMIVSYSIIQNHKSNAKRITPKARSALRGWTVNPSGGVPSGLYEFCPYFCTPEFRSNRLMTIHKVSNSSLNHHYSSPRERFVKNLKALLVRCIFKVIRVTYTANINNADTSSSLGTSKNSSLKQICNWRTQPEKRGRDFLVALFASQSLPRGFEATRRRMARRKRQSSWRHSDKHASYAEHRLLQWWWELARNYRSNRPIIIILKLSGLLIASYHDSLPRLPQMAT